jgi:hypothetical protein
MIQTPTDNVRRVDNREFDPSQFGTFAPLVPMQPDRNVPTRDNPQGQAKNRAKLLLVPPTLESVLKKSLAALAVAAATVAALAVPAGAVTPKATWTHQTVPCATGHKAATVTLKWGQHQNYVPMYEGDTGAYIQKGWYDNPCPHQWLLIGSCQPGSQSDCEALDVAPKHKGQYVPLSGAAVTLQSGPTCDNSGVTYVMYVPASRAPSCPSA